MVDILNSSFSRTHIPALDSSPPENTSHPSSHPTWVPLGSRSIAILSLNFSTIQFLQLPWTATPSIRCSKPVASSESCTFLSRSRASFGCSLVPFCYRERLYVHFRTIHFLRHHADLVKLSKFGPKGSWALITGASDGIGKEFALQIARQGFNVVLVSRTQAKLDALAEELKEKYNVETKVLAMDFALNSKEDYRSLAKLIDGLDISILINNVGLSHDIPVPFAETPEAEMMDIITINCIGTLKVTQMVAPMMVRKRRGFILTMSSFGGLLPTPLLATYSGSKSFLQQWSSATGSELSKHNVTVECVQSYLVTSAMSKVRRPSALIPTPRAFVKATLGGIGRSRGAQGMAYTSTPYWAHSFMQWGLETFVGKSSKLVVDQNRRMHEDIRKRALRKAEREAKTQ